MQRGEIPKKSTINSLKLAENYGILVKQNKNNEKHKTITIFSQVLQNNGRTHILWSIWILKL